MLNLKGEPAYVGRHCGSNVHEITPEVVAFYSEALGDHHPLYARVAPPLLHHSECFKFLGEWYLANLFGNLHARQDWELFGPMRVGGRVRTCSTIVDRYTRRGRLYVVNETDLHDEETGALLVRGRTHQSFLPEKEEKGGGRGNDNGTGYVVDTASAARKAPRPAFPTATGPDLESVTKVVDPHRCWMFSGPGRNYHTDREAAKQLGFPDIVVQGMMTTCFIGEVMLRAFEMGWVQGGRASLKLTNVVWVDEQLTARGKVREETPEGDRTRVHCDVWVEKTDGTRVLVGDASAVR